MGKIIILGSEKGGVAKTTSTYNLAYCLAKEGKKVLAVDFDSQANLSTCFGIEDTRAVPVTIGHLMMQRIEDEELPDAAEYIQSRNGVDFIPSSIMLSVVEAKLRLEMGAERMLAGILELLKGRYDYILVDTCPSLGSLTINALSAADGVIITVNPPAPGDDGAAGLLEDGEEDQGPHQPWPACGGHPADHVRCEDEPLQGHHGAGVRDIPGADTDIWEQDTQHRQGGGVGLLQPAACGVCAGQRGVRGIPEPGKGGDRG